MHLSSERETALEIISDYYGLPVAGDYWWAKSPVRAAEELYKMSENTNAAVRRDGENLIWEEWITNNFENQFLIQIVVRPGYPFSIPKAFVVNPNIDIDSAIHVNFDGSLCLFHSDDYTPHMSILEVRNQAAAWTWCYDVFRHSEEWPGAERPHDDDD